MANLPTSIKNLNTLLGNQLAEGGGEGGGGLIVNATDEGTIRTLDKTWKEIKDAIASGTHIYIKLPDIEGYEDNWYISVTGCFCIFGSNPQQYSVQTSDYNQPNYTTDSENGYPHTSFE